jgi:hypothetical protein
MLSAARTTPCGAIVAMQACFASSAAGQSRRLQGAHGQFVLMTM